MIINGECEANKKPLSVAKTRICDFFNLNLSKALAITLLIICMKADFFKARKLFDFFPHPEDIGNLFAPWRV